MPPKPRNRPAARLNKIPKKGQTVKTKAKPKLASQPAGRRTRKVNGREKKSKGVQELDKKRLTLEEIASGGRIVVDGTYWEGPVVAAGFGQGLDFQDGERYLKLKVEGTTSEALLHFLSGSPSKEVLAHLCGEPCERKVWKDGLIHVEKLALCKEEDKAEWMENAKEVKETAVAGLGVDDLAILRKEAEEAGKRKKEKKKRRSRSPVREQKDEEEKEKKKEEGKGGLRMKAKKELEQVLGATGLDPSPTIRRKFIKKARRLVEGKKKKKKKKKKSGGRSGSDSSTNEEESSGDTSSSEKNQGLDREEIFKSTSAVRRLAAEYPGTLTASWIRDCQDYLLNSQGQVWTQTESQVQPVAVQFFRTNVQAKMTGPMARECLSVAFMVDLLLQG